MRNPKRISELLVLIEKLWIKHPDLRLMQLLGNCLPPGDNYYTEDDELLDNLKFTYKRSLNEQKKH